MRGVRQLAMAILLCAVSPVAASAPAKQKDPEAKPPRAGLSFDELMKGATSPKEPAAAPSQRRPTIELPAPQVPDAPSRGQLTLDDIEGGREAVKIADAQERVRALAGRLESRCACTADDACFAVERFEHDEMNVLYAEQRTTYQGQWAELCAQWTPELAARLPAERPALADLELRLQLLLDTSRQMDDALSTRTAEFRTEEQRIRRAIAKAEADARARAEAQARATKKKSGFLASMITLGAGTVLADSMGAQIDPEALARTSLKVGEAVRDGRGVAGAIGAGVQGFNQMARTAVPKIDIPAPVAAGDMTSDALALVKRFPEPGSRPTPGYAPAFGSAAPPAALPTAPASPYADLFAAVGRPGTTPEAAAAAREAMELGGRMVASGVTPGGPGTDMFGVREPTRERHTFTCRERVNVPLVGRDGKPTYYSEREVTIAIAYWTPACGPAQKAFHQAHACNDIDDYARAEADCLSACGSPDCRDSIYERQVMGGGS